MPKVRTGFFGLVPNGLYANSQMSGDNFPGEFGQCLHDRESDFLKQMNFKA